MDKNIDYSVVVPVFRGLHTIGKLFESCKSFFNSESIFFEVVFVCDGASNEIWQEIVRLKNANSNEIKGIRLSRNFGQHNALICGFTHSSGRFIITMDEDLQHKPEDIHILIEKQKEGDYDLVYGSYKHPSHSLFRNTTSFLLRKLISIGIPGLHQDYSPFRLVKASIAKETQKMNNSYTFVDGYLNWITDSVSSIEVSHSDSKAGKSSYTIKKLIEHSINIFVTFSNIPIRLLIFISLSLFLFSTAYGTYILFRKLIYDDLISGFATMAVLSGFGFGILLFGMGVIGEYIQRVNLKTTRRPNYIEKETI